jgi:lipid-A-disaccharide synthase
LAAGERIRQTHPRVTVAVSCAATIEKSRIQTLVEKYPEVRIVDQATSELLNAADAALVASGTATLEAACFSVPFALVYKVARLSFAIGKRLVRIPYVGLVNVVAGKMIVKEFLQDKVNADDLTIELERLLFDASQRQAIASELQQVKAKLGEPGASERTARLIMEA